MMRPPTSRILVLVAAVVLAPAIGILASQVRFAVVSSGGVTTANDAWLNVGQSAIGQARSRTHQMVTGGIPILLELSTRQGDIDGDGAVNLDDHAIFVLCMAGPEVPTPPRGCSQAHFDLADVHTDNDVDLQDYGLLIELYTPVR